MPQFADALIMVERDRLQAQRDAKQRGDFSLPGDTSPRIDLWGVGLAMVWQMLN